MFIFLTPISLGPKSWFPLLIAAHFQQVSLTKRRQINHRRKLIYPHSIKLRSNYFFSPQRVQLVPFENLLQLQEKSRTSENIRRKQNVLNSLLTLSYPSVTSFLLQVPPPFVPLRWLPANHFFPRLTFSHSSENAEAAWWVQQKAPWPRRMALDFWLFGDFGLSPLVFSLSFNFLIFNLRCLDLHGY